MSADVVLAVMLRGLCMEQCWTPQLEWVSGQASSQNTRRHVPAHDTIQHARKHLGTCYVNP